MKTEVGSKREQQGAHCVFRYVVCAYVQNVHTMRHMYLPIMEMWRCWDQDLYCIIISPTVRVALLCLTLNEFTTSECGGFKHKQAVNGLQTEHTDCN